MLLVSLSLTFPAHAQPASPTGNWLTFDRDAVIAIQPCGQSLCGTIVGLDSPHEPNGGPALDFAGHPKCNEVIIQRTALKADGSWAGEITNPEDGQTYNCEFSVAADGRLHLRGYVLTPLFGQTQDWTRYTGRLAADCGMS